MINSRYNMKALSKILLLTCVVLTGCSTTKSKLKSQSKAHSETESKSTTHTDLVTEIKAYGDTLQGHGYLQVDTTCKDSTKADSIISESHGIKLTIKVTPQRNNKGQITGNRIDYTAIAKPTKTISSREVQQSKVSTTTKVDSTKQSKLTSSVKKGFSVPSWVWWVLLLMIALVVIYFLSPIITFIKKFI